MADAHTLQAIADLEAQRDDALVYLSAIRSVLDVVARNQGVRACAQAIAQVVVQELHVESCVVALREAAGAPFELHGHATQGQRFGGPSRGPNEKSWVAMAQLVDGGQGPAFFRGERDGSFTAVAPQELLGEGCMVLPFSVAGERSGALVLHVLIEPLQAFARRASLGLVADIVGQALTQASLRDGLQTVCSTLEGELGIARKTVSQQEETLRARHDHIQVLTSALIRSSRVKRDFLGAVSHELRTPLNGILGYASLLREGMVGGLDAEQTRVLDRVLANSHHLRALIDDVLFFIQIESDRVIVRREHLPTTELVEEALKGVPGRPVDDQVVLHVEIDPGAALLDVDGALFRRILFHLLANAFKFTAAGEVRLAIQPGAARGTVVLTVRDTGCGIPPDRTEAIFEVFSQGDPSATRRHDGLGMGLTLVQRCVQLLGGEVVVESQPGNGCEFRVLLPDTLVDTRASGTNPAHV